MGLVDHALSRAVSQQVLFFLFFFFSSSIVLRMKPRALGILGRCLTTETHPISLLGNSRQVFYH